MSRVANITGVGEAALPARRSTDGETRTRTGDTTIFRRRFFDLSYRGNACKQAGVRRLSDLPH